MTHQVVKHCTNHVAFLKACKDCAKAYAVWYRASHKEAIVERNRKCYQNKRNEYIAKSKERCKTEKAKIRQRQYAKHRANTDPLFKLARNLRIRLYTAMRLEYKSGSAVADLGCSIQEFKDYLTRHFQPGMSWENYGEWEIDHKIPISSFDLTQRDQLLKACHYSNLQPMWKLENRQKSDHNCGTYN